MIWSWVFDFGLVMVVQCRDLGFGFGLAVVANGLILGVVYDGLGGGGGCVWI